MGAKGPIDVAATDNSVVRSKLQMQQFVTAGVRGIIAASMGRLVHDEVEEQDADRTIPVVYCDQPTHGEDSFRFDKSGVAAALTRAAPPSAIATVADELAIGVIDAARRVGVRVRRPVHHDHRPADGGDGPPRRPATTYLPGRLVVRASCGHHDEQASAEWGMTTRKRIQAVVRADRQELATPAALYVPLGRARHFGRGQGITFNLSI